ncbi:MAG: trypsin-like peptidase domain-containing protein [Akkermansia sp.]
MIQPWSKENPAYSQGFGIYLGDGNILTAANIVYSASFVEVTSADGSQTVPVTVTAFDPEANLALLRLKNGKDAAFLDKLVPVALGKAPAWATR